MAQPREKPWLKNKNHLDKTENKTENGDNTKGKKGELMVFDFGENAGGEPEQGSSPRKQEEETTPRDTGRKGKAAEDDGPESKRTPRQDAKDKVSPRAPAAAAAGDEKSPRNEEGWPRKGEKAATDARNRRASPQRDGGYDADSSDSNDKPAAATGRRAPAEHSPERPAAKMNAAGKPKASDTSPRPNQPVERPVRNTFTGKSTLSL